MDARFDTQAKGNSEILYSIRHLCHQIALALLSSNLIHFHFVCLLVSSSFLSLFVYLFTLLLTDVHEFYMALVIIPKSNL